MKACRVEDRAYAGFPCKVLVMAAVVRESPSTRTERNATNDLRDKTAGKTTPLCRLSYGAKAMNFPKPGPMFPENQNANLRINRNATNAKTGWVRQAQTNAGGRAGRRRKGTKGGRLRQTRTALALSSPSRSA